MSNNKLFLLFQCGYLHIFKLFGFKAVKLSIMWCIVLDANLFFTLSVNPKCDFSWNILPVQSSFVSFSVAEAASCKWSYFPFTDQDIYVKSCYTLLMFL